MSELIEALYNTSFHDSGSCYSSPSTINNIEAEETENHILNLALTALLQIGIRAMKQVRKSSRFFKKPISCQ